MKTTLLFFFSLFSFASYAAVSTPEIEHSVVQGYGATIEEAQKSAMQAIPSGWKTDDSFSSLIECHETVLKQRPDDCDFPSNEEQVRLTLPIFKTIQ